MGNTMTKDTAPPEPPTGAEIKLTIDRDREAQQAAAAATAAGRHRPSATAFASDVLAAVARRFDEVITAGTVAAAGGDNGHAAGAAAHSAPAGAGPGAAMLLPLPVPSSRARGSNATGPLGARPSAAVAVPWHKARADDSLQSSSMFGSPLVSPQTGALFMGTAAPGGSATLARGLAPSPVHKTVSTVLTWRGEGNDVAVAGTFSDWNRVPLTKTEDEFSTIVELPIGSHTLRFFVDGEWRVSSELPTMPDPAGNLVNYIEINEHGYVTDPANDPVSTVKDDFDDKDFGQTLPPLTEDDKSAPPLLPPHLNRGMRAPAPAKVILNAEVPEDSDPSVLPVPDHVMLNHLYALSIRDGVMVLASTSRYRQKYVTSVLYTPVPFT